MNIATWYECKGKFFTDTMLKWAWEFRVSRDPEWYEKNRSSAIAEDRISVSRPGTSPFNGKFQSVVGLLREAAKEADSFHVLTWEEFLLVELHWLTVYMPFGKISKKGLTTVHMMYLSEEEDSSESTMMVDRTASRKVGMEMEMLQVMQR